MPQPPRAQRVAYRAPVEVMGLLEPDFLLTRGVVVHSGGSMLTASSIHSTSSSIRARSLARSWQNGSAWFGYRMLIRITRAVSSMWVAWNRNVRPSSSVPLASMMIRCSFSRG